MDESTSKAVRQITITILIVTGVTLNTLLLKGAGSSTDTLHVQDKIDLHVDYTQKQLRQNLEYLEERIAKAEARQDNYYNILNRRLDVFENKYERYVSNKATVTTTVNNTFSPVAVVTNNNNKKD